MLSTLSLLFSGLCGQNPDHTWVVGGHLLPCCQRCTGLYVGAFWAAGMHACFKPQFSKPFVLVHGGFLAQLALALIPWLAQGPVTRAFSGMLFASGVVAFLWPP